MNCCCFLAELYKLPHQSHNMSPPPLAINQWQRRRRHKMPSHFPELTSVSMFFSGRQEMKSASCFKAETSESTFHCRLSGNSLFITWLDGAVKVLIFKHAILINSLFWTYSVGSTHDGATKIHLKKDRDFCYKLEEKLTRTVEIQKFSCTFTTK